MTIGDRIRATRRPREKQSPERPVPGRPWNTATTPTTPTPTGDNSPRANIADQHGPPPRRHSTDPCLPSARRVHLTARRPCGHGPAPGPAVA